MRKILRILWKIEYAQSISTSEYKMRNTSSPRRYAYFDYRYKKYLKLSLRTKKRLIKRISIPCYFFINSFI